ncbi:hypothetical protein [Streptomyces sp. TE33382]
MSARSRKAPWTCAVPLTRRIGRDCRKEPLEAVTTLPPILVADLFGLGPATAEVWAGYANDSWTHCLAART